MFALLFAAALSSVQPNAAIMRPIDGALAAINADQGNQVQSFFVADAVVVDEEPPFLWKGSQAASRWWAHVDRQDAREHMGRLHVQSLGVTESRLDREGDDAYVTIALRISFPSRPKVHEEGRWVLTLHDFPAGWKITSATWATVP